MNRREHKTTARSEIVNAALHFINHFLGFAKWQHVLCVNASTPKDNVPPKLSFQLFRIHPFGGNLNRIRISKPISIRSGIKSRVAPQL